MTTPPDDVAALFDLPPEPESSPSTQPSLEDEEAALAAELAASIEADGGVAGDAPDSRTDRRVEVTWPARMQLPDGHVMALVVRNLSESGMGLASDEPIPAHTVVNFEMDVPPFDDGDETTPVKGTIKTTYAIVHRSKILCGGTWVQAPPAGLALVNKWVARLRR